MPDKRQSLWLPLLLCLFAPVACAPGPIDFPGISQATKLDSAYRLGPGDKIRLSLYGEEEFSGMYRVSSTGMVSLPLVGDHEVSGKSIPTFVAEVTERLKNGYYRNPLLSAEISEYRPFYILGEVQRPGYYPYVVGLTLDQAVAIAGGYTYRANKKILDLQMENRRTPIRVRSDAAIRIGPGDTIKILERYF